MQLSVEGKREELSLLTCIFQFEEEIDTEYVCLEFKYIKYTFVWLKTKNICVS